MTSRRTFLHAAAGAPLLALGAPRFASPAAQADPQSLNLVHGDATPLQAGMCFSDEPGIYIPGEFGVRLEDCWVMTAAGPRSFTPLAQSLDAPI